MKKNGKTGTRSLRFAALLMAVLLTAAACLSGTGCSIILITDEEQSAGDTSAAESDTSRGEDNPTGRKRIAFTFDDGPQAPAEDLDAGYYPYTTYILDKVESLQKEGHQAEVTFFVVGSRAAEYPSALTRADALGCEIGSHTYNHDSVRGKDQAFIADTLSRASDAIAAAGVPRPKLYRPVGGAITADQLAYTASLGYTAVAWSIDTNDWNNHPKTADKYSEDASRKEAYEQFVNEKVQLILDSASDGDIVLMHDLYMSSVDIFIRAADKLIGQGYDLVTVSTLLGLDDESQPVAEMYIARGQTVTHMD
jgi:peptidoglycan-N-acetylglucosamine deacetylase